MPKIQIVASISGTRDGTNWPAPGETLNVPQAEADDLIRAGIAIAPQRDAEPRIEKAVAPKAETRKGLTTKSV